MGKWGLVLLCLKTEPHEIHHDLLLRVYTERNRQVSEKDIYIYIVSPHLSTYAFNTSTFNYTIIQTYFLRRPLKHHIIKSPARYDKKHLVLDT